MFCDISLGFASLQSGCDISLAKSDLQGDSTLYTAVLVSLFTDRVAEPYEELPAGELDRKGWWGDFLDESPQSAYGGKIQATKARKLGSKLWLLRREKQLSSVVLRAEQYASDALAWMLEDKLVSSVSVKGSIARNGVLALSISLGIPAQSFSRLSPAGYETQNWSVFYDYQNSQPLAV